MNVFGCNIMCRVFAAFDLSFFIDSLSSSLATTMYYGEYSYQL